MAASSLKHAAAREVRKRGTAVSKRSPGRSRLRDLGSRFATSHCHRTREVTSDGTVRHRMRSDRSLLQKRTWRAKISRRCRSRRFPSALSALNGCQPPPRTDSSPSGAVFGAPRGRNRAARERQPPAGDSCRTEQLLNHSRELRPKLNVISCEIDREIRPDRIPLRCEGA